MGLQTAACFCTVLLLSFGIVSDAHGRQKPTKKQQVLSALKKLHKRINNLPGDFEYRFIIGVKKLGIAKRKKGTRGWKRAELRTAKVTHLKSVKARNSSGGFYTDFLFMCKKRKRCVTVVFPMGSVVSNGISIRVKIVSKKVSSEIVTMITNLMKLSWSRKSGR